MTTTEVRTTALLAGMQFVAGNGDTVTTSSPLFMGRTDLGDPVWFVTVTNGHSSHTAIHPAAKVWHILNEQEVREKHAQREREDFEARCRAATIADAQARAYDACGACGEPLDDHGTCDWCELCENCGHPLSEHDRDNDCTAP